MRRFRSTTARDNRTTAAFEPLESRRLMSAGLGSGGVWKIRGDAARDRDDVILVEASPDDASLVRATVNGVVVATHPARDVSRIEVRAGRGNDSVVVNLGGHADAS